MEWVSQEVRYNKPPNETAIRHPLGYRMKQVCSIPINRVTDRARIAVFFSSPLVHCIYLSKYQLEIF